VADNWKYSIHNEDEEIRICVPFTDKSIEQIKNMSTIYWIAHGATSSFQRKSINPNPVTSPSGKKY